MLHPLFNYVYNIILCAFAIFNPLLIPFEKYNNVIISSNISDLFNNLLNRILDKLK